MAGLRRLFSHEFGHLRAALEQAVLAREAIPAISLRNMGNFMECTHARRSVHSAVRAGAFERTPRASLAAQLSPPARDVSALRRTLFIQTQSTPNPTSLMFLPGKPVMESGTQGFMTPREAMASPLAKTLFHIDGVQQVFFGTDFVTVTKNDEYAWSVLKPDVFAAITEFYSTGQPVMYEGGTIENRDNVINEDDDEIVAMIKELLETRIRPAVQEDGGDVSFRGFNPDSGIVTLKMLGACSGCPSSALTLKGGIENMLSHYVPEVKGVIEAPADEHEIAGLEAFNNLEKHLSH